MIAKIVSCCLALVISSSTVLAARAPELSSKFKSASAFGVPGVVLPAGSFSVNIVEHLRDRYIVQIQDQAGDVLATFLGLPSNTVGKPADGKVSWTAANKGVSYLKGWYFPSGSVGVEFVYPKGDAVALAQANHARVAAIDPASDGLLIPPTKELTAQDLQIVTLWLLTPTRVGATGADGIEAKRYDQVASLGHKPALRALPHTASDLAWFYLVGTFSLAGAAGMRMKRASNLG